MNTIGEKRFASHAKLMISGEYLVLKGALALALPLKYGQSLTVEAKEGKSVIQWRSLINNLPWFSTTILLPDLRVLDTNSPGISATLCTILSRAKSLQPNFIDSTKEYHVISSMDFLPEWGFGSSSSLISNVADWAECDPFELNRLIFNGSGYDIACARSTSPIIYKISNGQPSYKRANFQPSFGQQLYFVYLNRKQNSQKSINGMDLSMVSQNDLQAISDLTSAMENTQSLENFQWLLDLHEEYIGWIVRKEPVKSLYFDDFEGSLKSLGAWGGDFILVASDRPEEYVRNYFYNKNLHTMFKYNEIILAN
ncbi:MAG: GYDIA family GHMP kinase [Prolixibacteraceae bacterium]|jgi:mevalonate kinase|nr:GYDIA family GHMP kinase [Prolixibacteraceae bacterium]